MSRRLYVSTEISTDKAVNRLAMQHSDFAALLYTWLIPHAEDDATFPADPEELLMKVCPGRRDKQPEDIQAALDMMLSMGLIERCDDVRRLRFPTGSFYKYQTYIKGDRRNSAQTAAETEQPALAAQDTADQRNSAQSTASFSFSSSDSSSSSPSEVHGADAPSAPDEPAPIREVFDYYRDRIQAGAKLTDKARRKISTRLSEFTVQQIRLAIDHFAADWWQMENNAHRGADWWFHSEERVLSYLNLKPRPKEQRNGTNRASELGTDKGQPDSASRGTVGYGLEERCTF
jgi:hypothetical protein